VIRIALSGYTEMESALRALPVAHQFLSKPCDSAVIENVLERACSLQSLLADPAIRNAVGSVGELPSTPRIYSALTQMLADPDVDQRAVAGVIEQDPAVSARVLQIVNSAFFGLSQPIAGLTQAVLHLGIEAIKNLVFTAELFRSFPVRNGFSVDLLQQHSYLTAKIAAAIVNGHSKAQDAFTAALLHDVERQLHGFTHAEAGAYLLGLWGLPYPIVEAVAHHHAPRRVKQCAFDTLAAVFVADHLAWQQTPERGAQVGAAVEPLDMAYLESLGVAGELQSWQAVAHQQAELLASPRAKKPAQRNARTQARNRR
jgi:HD-like signal output (HDOD) protein